MLDTFDTVPHQRLLNKLTVCCIKGYILNWDSSRPHYVFTHITNSTDCLLTNVCYIEQSNLMKIIIPVMGIEARNQFWKEKPESVVGHGA